MADLPEWMIPGADSLGIVPHSRAARISFARKALKQMGRLSLRTLRSRTSVGEGEFLKRIDPRAKVVAFLGLIVICTFLRSPSSLALCIAAALGAAVISRLPLKAYAGTLIVAAGFGVSMALPASLSVITPGKAVLVLWHPQGFWRTALGFPAEISLTGDGLFVASRLALRTMACASLGLLLAFSTRAGKLFSALRSLGVPRSFVLMLGMGERYALVLARSARELHLAKLSRTIFERRVGQEQRWVAGGIATLFRKTRSLSNAVELAMASRGYTGEAKALKPERLEVGDWLFLSAVSAFAAVLLASG